MGAWSETVGTEDERNARDDRELAPKGDMENDRRKWKRPLQVAQGTGAGF